MFLPNVLRLFFFVLCKTDSIKSANGTIRPSESLSGTENSPRDPKEGIVQMKNKTMSAPFVSCTILKQMLPNAVMQVYVLNASCRFGRKRKNFLAVHFAAAKS